MLQPPQSHSFSLWAPKYSGAGLNKSEICPRETGHPPQHLPTTFELVTRVYPAPAAHESSNDMTYRSARCVWAVIFARIGGSRLAGTTIFASRTLRSRLSLFVHYYCSEFLFKYTFSLNYILRTNLNKNIDYNNWEVAVLSKVYS